MLKNQLTLLLLIVLVFTTSILSSCKEEKKSEEKIITEGIIEYQVSYPYYKDAFMVKLLPDVMTMEFKNNVYKNEITKGGLFTTSIISDCNTFTTYMTLDFGYKKMYCTLDKSLTDTMVSLLFNIPDILPAINYTNLLDLPTKKYNAIYKTLDAGYDCELYTTQAIKINNSNWCNPFKAIDEVLLGYEVAQYGMVMRFLATKITEQKLEKNTFEIPESFEKVTLERMIYEMEEIFKSIIE